MIVTNFVNVKKDHDIEFTVMDTNKVWAIEQVMLEIYSLLAHRLHLGWSLKDFWEVDTWTTSKLYCMEVNLIENEKQEFRNNKPNYEEYNSPEADSMYRKMFGDEE